MSYSMPETVDGAIALASSREDVAFVAGGTDLLVQRQQGNAPARHLIDIHRISALQGISVSDGSVSIGAAVTLASICRDPELRSRFPALVNAARSVASPLIRASATIAGNLLCQNRCVYFDQSEFWRDAVGYCLKCGGEVCIATGGTKSCFSVFISDIAPVLICLDAEVEYVVRESTKRMPVEKLYTGDGQAPHALPHDALITRIVIPRGRETVMYFRKLRPRESVDFTNLTLAMRCDATSVTVAASGVGPGPAVVRVPIDVDSDVILKKLLARTQIIDNLAYARHYRREMLARMVAEGRSESGG